MAGLLRRHHKTAELSNDYVIKQIHIHNYPNSALLCMIASLHVLNLIQLQEASQD